MSNKVQMGAVKGPRRMVRLKFKKVPTVKVRMKDAGPKSQVVIINECDYDKELHTKASGRVALSDSGKAKDAGAGEGEGAPT